MAGTTLSSSLSRRSFLVGCAGCVAAAAAPMAGTTDTATTDTTALLSTRVPSRVSPEGRASIATTDRRFQQQRPQMSETVRAVEDLGLDPTGKEPVNGKLGPALSGMSNTRVVFPKGGTFALAEHETAIPEGPVEIVGNGSSFVIPSGEEIKSLTLVLPAGSLIRDITIDQSAKGALQELSIQAESGVVRADNVTIKGYAPAKRSGSDGGGVDAMFSPIARTSESVVRATNFKAVGGTAAGTHNEDDKPADSYENTYGAPMGVWVGKDTAGTIQLVAPKLQGWSNGIYGGRTSGIVEVRGGTFVNNFNGNTRLGGGSVVDGASILLDDRQWSDKGPKKIGHQGVYAARVDAKGGNTTDPIRFLNLRVKAMSMRSGASLFEWESASGPGVIRNCHITNHLDRPVVTGRPPSTSGATNILVDQSRIDGDSSAGITDIQNRPQSRIQQTCITTAGAGPDDINGAQVGSGVTFGQCTSESGLSKPKKVGSGGNLSSLPAPSINGTGSAANARRRQKKRKKTFLVTVVGGALLVIGLFVGVLIALLLMVAVLSWGIVALLSSD
jgi:hypothetical protein